MRFRSVANSCDFLHATFCILLKRSASHQEELLYQSFIAPGVLCSLNNGYTHDN